MAPRPQHSVIAAGSTPSALAARMDRTAATRAARLRARIAAAAASTLAVASFASCRSFPPPPPGFAAASFEQLAAEPAWRAFALEQGAVIYAAECARCHGDALEGTPGYPELRDATWIWSGGGDVATIADVVRHGVRVEGATKGSFASGTRHGTGQSPPVAMPPYDDVLDDAQIAAAAAFTEQLIATAAVPAADAPLLKSRGADVYASACAACHGVRGEGQPQLGFVRLAGGNSQIEARQREDLEELIREGMEARSMKAFAGDLAEDEIRCVALYVAEVAAGRASAAKR